MNCYKKKKKKNYSQRKGKGIITQTRRYDLKQLDGKTNRLTIMMSTRSRTWPLEINVVSSCGTIFDTANPISIIVEKVSLIDTIAARNSVYTYDINPRLGDNVDVPIIAP